MCTYLHSTSVTLNYMILHAELNIHVHECRPIVYLLAAAELGSSLALLSETSSKLGRLELLMHIRECKSVMAEQGPSLELLLETSLRAVR